MELLSEHMDHARRKRRSQTIGDNLMLVAIAMTDPSLSHQERRQRAEQAVLRAVQAAPETQR